MLKKKHTANGIVESPPTDEGRPACSPLTEPDAREKGREL
jgi:hypothetical protein